MNAFAEIGAGSWLWDVAGLLTIPALILLNGLFVAAEFALVTVRKTHVRNYWRKASLVRAPFSTP